MLVKGRRTVNTLNLKGNHYVEDTNLKNFVNSIL